MYLRIPDYECSTGCIFQSHTAEELHSIAVRNISLGYLSFRSKAMPYSIIDFGSVAHCSWSQDIDLFKFQLSYCYNPPQDTCPITSPVLGHLMRTHVPLIFLLRDKKSYRLSEKCATLFWSSFVWIKAWSYPCKCIEMCQGWVKIGTMWLALGSYWPSSGMLWVAWYIFYRHKANAVLLSIGFLRINPHEIPNKISEILW